MFMDYLGLRQNRSDTVMVRTTNNFGGFMAENETELKKIGDVFIYRETVFMRHVAMSGLPIKWVEYRVGGNRDCSSLEADALEYEYSKLNTK